LIADRLGADATPPRQCLARDAFFVRASITAGRALTAERVLLTHEVGTSTACRVESTALVAHVVSAVGTARADTARVHLAVGTHLARRRVPLLPEVVRNIGRKPCIPLVELGLTSSQPGLFRLFLEDPAARIAGVVAVDGSAESGTLPRGREGLGLAVDAGAPRAGFAVLNADEAGHHPVVLAEGNVACSLTARAARPRGHGRGWIEGATAGPCARVVAHAGIGEEREPRDRGGGSGAKQSGSSMEQHHAAENGWMPSSLRAEGRRTPRSEASPPLQNAA